MIENKQRRRVTKSKVGGTFLKVLYSAVYYIPADIKHINVGSMRFCGARAAMSRFFLEPDRSRPEKGATQQHNFYEEVATRAYFILMRYCY